VSIPCFEPIFSTFIYLSTLLGGKNSFDNFQPLHRHCHDLRIGSDGRLIREGIAKQAKVGI
jgi:hypothetical protein